MGQDYLVTADYQSNFCKLDSLTSSKSVITKVKAHFARMGIPTLSLVETGHNSAQMTLHTSSGRPLSPYNSRSNSKVESSVKSDKNILERRGSAVVSTSACHAGGRGSLPRPGTILGVKPWLYTLEIVYLCVFWMIH